MKDFFKQKSFNYFWQKIRKSFLYLDCPMPLYVKLYEVFKEKFIRDYAEKDYVSWQSFLEKNSIKQKIFDGDDQNYLYQEMLELANTNNGTWVVIDDPESDGECNPEAEHHGILLVPKSFAEKVVVLNDVPEPE